MPRQKRRSCCAVTHFFCMPGMTTKSYPCCPQAVHEICSLYAHGKHAKSLYLQLQYLPVIEALFSDVSPIAVKAALEQMGMPVGPCRMPLGELDGAKREKLYETLQKAGLLRQAS